MLLNSQNLKYNMKGGFPIKPNYRAYDVIISARMKPLARHSLTSATLAKLRYVSKLKKTNATNNMHFHQHDGKSPKEGFVYMFSSYQDIL